MPVTRSKELFNVGSWALGPHENRAQVILFKLNVKVFKEVNEFGMNASADAAISCAVSFPLPLKTIRGGIQLLKFRE